MDYRFKHRGGIYKTTNGGLNWLLQTLPSGNNIYHEIYKFKIINYDTIYAVGGYKDLGFRIIGLIWKTTNSGMNWGYQEPDTSIQNGQYYALDFINANTGWAYSGNGIHTTNGGGPIIISSININNENIVKSYILEQNYPNPFNPTTVISFQLSVAGQVVLKVYDVMGREVQTLVNESLKPGTYQASFDASALSSGIYFYTLSAGEFSETKKMLMVK